MTKTIANTGLCSISDAGAQFDIHPKEKRLVGERLALPARGKVYGEALLCEAPTACGIEKDGNLITVSFDHAEGGLVLKGPDVRALSVTADGKETRFQARI